MKLFFCERYLCKLTKNSCVQRYHHGQRKAESVKTKGEINLTDLPYCEIKLCITCPIGKQHAEELGELVEIQREQKVNRKKRKSKKTIQVYEALIESKTGLKVHALREQLDLTDLQIASALQTLKTKGVVRRSNEGVWSCTTIAY